MSRGRLRHSARRSAAHAARNMRNQRLSFPIFAWCGQRESAQKPARNQLFCPKVYTRIANASACSRAARRITECDTERRRVIAEAAINGHDAPRPSRRRGQRHKTFAIKNRKPSVFPSEATNVRISDRSLQAQPYYGPDTGVENGNVSRRRRTKPRGQYLSLAAATP